MPSLRFRLISLVVLTLVAGAVSQSAGARTADAQSSLPVSVFAHNGTFSQWPGASRSPVLAAIRAAAARSGVSNGLRLLPDTSFFADRDVSFGDSAFSASWADYDADGRLDVLTLGCDDMSCSNAVIKLFHNNGDGTFSEVTNTGLPSLWGSVASWADYDSDGYVDVLISGCPDDMCSTIFSKLYHNNGNGTFTENTHAGLPGVFTLFGGGVATWADYNNDGRPDVMIVGLTSTDLRVTNVNGFAPVVSSSAKLYQNKGDGTFSEVTNSGLPNLLSGLTDSVSWSDYDSDGYEDVLISGCSDAACSTFAGRLFHNNGNGTFTENTQAGLPGIFSPIGVNPVTWGDYDGDGRLDVLLTGSTSGEWILRGLQRNLIDPMVPVYVTKLFHNNGDGTFSEDTHAGLPQTMITAVAWGDFNSDGRLDLLINHRPDAESFDYTATLFRNNGDGTFSEETSERHASTYIGLAWGDYNSDDRPDILVSDLSWGMNSGIYKNNSTATVTPLAAPTNLVARNTAKRFITFSWEESSSKTPSNSVTYNLRVGTSSGGSDIVSPMSNTDGARSVVQYGNAEGRTFATVEMPSSGIYHWSVQTVSAGFTGSAFAQDERFVLPPFITIKRPAWFNACGAQPLSTTVRGNIGRLFPPTTVFLQARSRRLHSSWRNIAQTTSSAQGDYSFSDVGKGRTKSFWIRAVSSPDGVKQLRSGSRRVIVKRAFACEMIKGLSR